MTMLWPESVLVLDPACGHELILINVPGASPDNQPRTAMQWAEDEFRLSPCGPHGVQLMLQIWEYRFRYLLALRAKYPHTYNEYDVYNGTWVSCGYETNQPKKALQLSGKHFTNTRIDTEYPEG